MHLILLEKSPHAQPWTYQERERERERGPLLSHDILTSKSIHSSEPKREQKPFLDANVKKMCSSSGAIPGAIIWRLNSDQPYLGKNG